MAYGGKGSPREVLQKSGIAPKDKERSYGGMGSPREGLQTSCRPSTQNHVSYGGRAGFSVMTLGCLAARMPIGACGGWM